MSRKTIPTVFLDKVPNYKFDVRQLLLEFETRLAYKMEDVISHGNKVLVQRKYHLIQNNKAHFDLEYLPYTKETIDKITEIFSFDSVNYRYVMPNTAYNWHCDKGANCLHIPLITNPGCWFVFENRSFSMPADGSLYTVNNSRMHTFVNSGSEPRLHLTFETLD